MVYIIKQVQDVSEGEKEKISVPFLSIDKVPDLEITDTVLNFDVAADNLKIQKNDEVQEADPDIQKNFYEVNVKINGKVTSQKNDLGKNK